MSQIFFLDISISKLQLDDRLVRDAGEEIEFFVKIHLLNLPHLDISWEGLVENNCCEIHEDYYSGRVCYFVAERREVVKILKSKPLRIEVYKKTERFPTCLGLVPFSGCICDLVTESLEKTSSFKFGGTFNLVEPGGNPAGTLGVNIILTDLGRHVINSFALDRDSFVLKNLPEFFEYKCGKINATNLSPMRNDNAVLSTEKLMSDMGSIFLCAARLSQGKPERKRAREPLAVAEEKINEESEVHKGTKKKSKIGSSKKTKRR